MFIGRDSTYATRQRFKKVIPERWHGLFKPLAHAIAYLTNAPPTMPFVLFPPLLPKLSYPQRLRLAYGIDRISRHVKCEHNQMQMLSVCELVLNLPSGVKGVIVEAGSFKGGSGAKLSLLAKMTNRQLHLFDSFEGMPENTEPHQSGLWGQDLHGAFQRGNYRGSLDEVKQNIARYGAPEVCTYHKGWFDDTMPQFKEKICAAYVDVDLASSTQTCLKYLYPLVVPGGAIFSQDGHIPLVVDVFRDEAFWKEEVGCPKPRMEGLGTSPLVVIHKEVSVDENFRRK